MGFIESIKLSNTRVENVMYDYLNAVINSNKIGQCGYKDYCIYHFFFLYL